MAITATTRPGYRWRLGLIALVMTGFGLYCVYDWQIGYPHEKEIYDAYVEIKEKHPKTHPNVWDQKARAEGWSTKPPKERTDTDIFTQLVMALITLPIGLYFTYAFIRSLSRSVTMDDEGLKTNAGKRASWQAIKDVDRTRWKTKGIAVVHYEGPDGKGSITLDDWKFEEAPTRSIMKAIDERLGYVEQPPPQVPAEAPSQSPAAAEPEEQPNNPNV
jgi:hypothetical protein